MESENNIKNAILISVYSLIVVFFISLSYVAFASGDMPKNINEHSINETTLFLDETTNIENTQETIVETTMETTIETEPKMDFSLLKDELTEYIDTLDFDVGLNFISLYDNTEFGINEENVFFAASTIKIPINLLLYEKVQNGELNLDTIMTYIKSSDYEGGTGKLQFDEDGTQYSLKELSMYSITLSDNVATRMIMRAFGGRSKYKDFMLSLGGKVVDYEENISTPSDISVYMKALYDFYLEYTDLGADLINSLENTIFNERLPKYLPEGTKIAHKIGNWDTEGSFHDVGIVFGDKPYIICVMTKGAGQEPGYEAIANISKMVYDFIYQ